MLKFIKSFLSVFLFIGGIIVGGTIVALTCLYIFANVGPGYALIFGISILALMLAIMEHVDG
jgi:hypothetical protein